jgi:hypothetical protein
MASRSPIRVQSRGRPFGKGRLWPLGGPALREPCRLKAVGGLELVCLAQGKVILAGSTFRREKVRLEPRTGTLIMPSLDAAQEAFAVDGP